MLSKSLSRLNNENILSIDNGPIYNVDSVTDFYQKMKSVEEKIAIFPAYHIYPIFPTHYVNYIKMINTNFQDILNAETIPSVIDAYIPKGTSFENIKLFFKKIDHIRKLCFNVEYYFNDMSHPHLAHYFNENKKGFNHYFSVKDGLLKYKENFVEMNNLDYYKKYKGEDDISIKKVIDVLNLISSEANNIEELEIDAITLYYFQKNKIKFPNLQKLKLNFHQYSAELYSDEDYNFNLIAPCLKYLSFYRLGKGYIDTDISINQDNYKNLISIGTFEHKTNNSYMYLKFTGVKNRNIANINMAIKESNLAFPLVREFDSFLLNVQELDTFKFFPNLKFLTVRFTDINYLITRNIVSRNLEILNFTEDAHSVTKYTHELINNLEKFPLLRSLNFNKNNNKFSFIPESFDMTQISLSLRGTGVKVQDSKLLEQPSLFNMIKNIEKIKVGNSVFMEMKNDSLFVKNYECFREILLNIPDDIKHVIVSDPYDDKNKHVSDAEKKMLKNLTSLMINNEYLFSYEKDVCVVKN